MANEILGFDPFVELNAYRDALRQLVEGGWFMPRDLLPSAVAAVVIPLDLIDNGPELVIQTNLPGVKPEDVAITVAGDTLTIKGSLNQQEQFQGASYLRRERRNASFTRSISLPLAVDAEHGQARFQNGVLTLTLPKSEAVRPKTIKVVQETEKP
ncbi:MAG TPA: Hsp20/alpha crystallin family protein [Anaerolineaceae bacterium]|nr:Hsp20/alpha crystallin family protein [Anaerolineaceae bacterium]